MLSIIRGLSFWSCAFLLSYLILSCRMSSPTKKPCLSRVCILRGHLSNSTNLCWLGSISIKMPHLCMLSRSVWNALRPYGLVVSVLNPLQPHELLSSRLLCPWNCFLGKNTEVGCHFLLQGIFLTQGWNRVSCISCIAGGFPSATGEALKLLLSHFKAQSIM